MNMPLSLNSYITFCLSVYLAFAITAPETSLAQDSKIVIPAVTVAVVKSANLQSRIHVDGTVVAREMVEIYSQLNNTQIQEVLVDVGDRVSKGDVLMRLDERRLKAEKTKTEAEIAHSKATIGETKGQINAAEVSFAAARANLERKQKLVASGNTSAATLDQARSENAKADSALKTAKDTLLVANARLNTTRANDDLAALDLEHASIVTHSAGVIAERNAVVGDLATTGSTSPLFKIIRGGDLEVEVLVFESSFLTIDIGDEAQFQIADTVSVSGKVRQKQPVVDKQTRLGRVRVALQSNAGLQTGLSAHGSILTENRMGLIVPVTALGTDETGEFVHKVVGTTVRKQPVTTGILFNGSIEIQSGLSEGETVLARAGAFFRDGDTVRPVVAKDAVGTKESAGK